jgi:hypothetical protein
MPLPAKINPTGFAFLDMLEAQPRKPPLMVRVMDGDVCVGYRLVRNDDDQLAQFLKMVGFMKRAPITQTGVENADK